MFPVFIIISAMVFFNSSDASYVHFIREGKSESIVRNSNTTSSTNPEPEGTMVTPAAVNQLFDWSKAHKDKFVAKNGHGSETPSLTASLTAGPYGPVLLRDASLLEALSRLNRERIPARIFFAKGTGAHGYFQVTNPDLTKYTKANIFSSEGRKTDAFCRFSISIGGPGTPDSKVGLRGFSCKFYTNEGNWDLVTSTGYVWPIRDPMLMPHFVHVVGNNPVTNLYDLNAVFDFWSSRPETALFSISTFGDGLVPATYRHVDTSAKHTYKLINSQGQITLARFFLISDQGLRNLTLEEVRNLGGTSPDFATIDLYDSIAAGVYPSWTLKAQLMPLEDAKSYEYDPLDTTKFWHAEDHPLITFGKLVLNRNPTNHFSEVEMAAFSPYNLVRGIQLASCPLTDATAFAYRDAQLYRLGTNFEQLPINRPKIPVHNYYRDGQCVSENGDGAPNYYPNSFGGPTVDPDAEKDEAVNDSINGVIGRYEPSDEMDFEVARMWLEKMSAGERQKLVTNTAFFLSNAGERLQKQMFEQFSNVSKILGDELKKETEKFNGKKDRPRLI